MVVLSVKKAKSFKEKVVGLIGSQKPYPFLLNTRFGIHTIGLKFPIDILILDKNGKVRAIKEKLAPYRIFFWNPFFDTVLELPYGTVRNKNIKIGNKIEIVIN